MSAPAMPAAAALEARALVCGYERDLPIVRGVDFALFPGELVAVLGPNGAGKSTFAKALAGLVPVFGGEVLVGGRSMAGVPAHRRVSESLAFVPQTENVFATLTVRENLALAAAVLPRLERRERIEAALLPFPDLARRPNLLAGSLSGGQRQMLACARALLTSPRAIILDEPSAGLSPKLVGEVFARLEAIRRSGVAVLLVEQNVRAALGVAARAMVLVEGRVAHLGPAAGLADSGRLGALFLGGGARAA